MVVDRVGTTEMPLLLTVHLLEILRECFGEGFVHVDFVFDAKFSAAFFANTLLPQHMLCIENERL